MFSRVSQCGQTRKYFSKNDCFLSMCCHVSQCGQTRKHFCEAHCFLSMFCDVSSVGKLGNVLLQGYFVSATMFLEVGKQGNLNRKHVFETVYTEVKRLIAKHVSASTFHSLPRTCKYLKQISSNLFHMYGCLVLFHIFVVGECDLPIFRAGEFMNDNNFRASGFLGRRHGPSQARFDSNFAWCDSGLKSDAYVQVDFDGPLRVIGIATRRQQEHWGSWVTSYQVWHSLNGMEWSYVKVNGSTVRPVWCFWRFHVCL